MVLCLPRRPRTRGAHRHAIELAPACAHVLVRTNEIYGSRTAIVALRNEPFDVALGVISVEQRFSRIAANDERELPHEIVDVLHAAVGAARTEWAYEVRRVAREEEPAVTKFLHAPALECVHARPFERELGVPS